MGAFEALEEWMEYRRISGEDINGESWLMRTVWDTTTSKRRRKMSRGAIKMLIIRALSSEGKRTSIAIIITITRTIHNADMSLKRITDFANPSRQMLNQR